MSLDSLANHTGLAKNYISKVEKGQEIPTVSAILRLSRALGIESRVLLSEEGALNRKKPTEYSVRKTKGYSYQILTDEKGQKNLKAFRVFLDPKPGNEETTYQHLGEEFVYVLKGNVEIAVGDNSNVLSTGDSLLFNSSIVHKLKNVGDEEAELLVMLYVP